MDTKRVYTVEHLELLDGKTMVVKPFSIKKNRLAKPMLDKILSTRVRKDEEGNDMFDEDGDPIPELSEAEAEALFLDVCAMAMEGQSELQPLLDDRDLLEDALDTQTIYEIVKVTTGYDFLAMVKQGQALRQRMLEMQQQA